MSEDSDKACSLYADMAIAVLPWLCMTAIFIWGLEFGPNARPTWPVGNRFLYDGCILFGFWGFLAGYPVFIVTRHAVHRERPIIALCTVISSMLAGLLFPGLAFA